MRSRSLILLGLLCGCGAAPAGGPRDRVTSPSGDGGELPSDSASCGAVTGALRPASPLGQSSSVVLGRFERGPLAKSLLAMVADEDGRAVAVVDVDTKRTIATVPLPEAPRELLLLPDGRLLATLPRADRLAAIRFGEDGKAALACTRETDAEPISIAVTKAADAVFVSSGWGASLGRFDAGLERGNVVSLPRDPRQVVLSDDERLAFVSHAVGGKVSVVDVAKGAALEAIPIVASPFRFGFESEAMPLSLTGSVELAASGVAAKLVPGVEGVRVGAHGMSLVKSASLPGRLLLPQIMVDPGDPSGRSEGYGTERSGAQADVTVIDMVARRTLPAPNREGLLSGEMLDSRGVQIVGQSGCLEPRGAAVDDATATLFVVCFGAGTLAAYDAASASPIDVEVGQWDVGAGPTGVAVDPVGRRAIVWSQLERSVDIVHLDELGAVERPAGRPRREKIDLPALANGPSLDTLLGRQIFYGIADSRISSQGLACATCHVEGRDDGLVWRTPEGPRRTPALAGRLEAPFGWTGASEDLEAHLDKELGALHGTGLRSVQRTALLSYLSTLQPPTARRAADAALTERGRALFDSKGCATCHPGGGTDGKAHDVGSKAGGDKKGSFDTPSLRRLAGRAPFFHDGRYATLRELLEDGHGEGTTKTKLDAAETEALETYLSTL
ncbi:MAG: c-type cytochrome [Myxococcales bacterium]|nr:c-type cytochrome [Myxococcales bacterium]